MERKGRNINLLIAIVVVMQALHIWASLRHLRMRLRSSDNHRVLIILPTNHLNILKSIQNIYNNSHSHQSQHLAKTARTRRKVKSRNHRYSRVAAVILMGSHRIRRRRRIIPIITFQDKKVLVRFWCKNMENIVLKYLFLDDLDKDDAGM